ncbi:MAG: hypothetical protein WAT12_10395 [Candidatus Nitrotoga sp.]
MNLDADNDAALKCGLGWLAPHYGAGSVANPRILPPIPMNNLYQQELA